MIEFWLIPVFILVVVVLSGIRIVRPTERAVIETLGRYSGSAKPGFNWIVPVFQRMVQVNITEQMSEIDSQRMITEDKLNVDVDLVVFYKVKDDEENVKKALYNINDFSSQIVTIAQTNGRAVIGKMPFNDVNANRNELNEKLAEIMAKETKNWGVEVVRVEFKEIVPPQDVQDTMNKVIKAQNDKRSAIDFATAEETKADGIKRAKIKEAEGEKQSAILKAEGQAKAFDLINKSFQGNAKELKQLEVTENSLRNNAKIVLTQDGISPQLILGELPVKKSDKD